VFLGITYILANLLYSQVTIEKLDTSFERGIDNVKLHPEELIWLETVCLRNHWNHINYVLKFLKDSEIRSCRVMCAAEKIEHEVNTSILNVIQKLVFHLPHLFFVLQDPLLCILVILQLYDIIWLY
jgi:hypothetical protein